LIFDTFAMFASFALSFTDYQGVGAAHFIGLANFQKMWGDATLHKALWNTMAIWLLTVPVLSFGSLVIAWCIESRLVRPLRAFLRTALFLPVLPSLVVVAIIFLLIMDPTFGLVGQLFRHFGLNPININTNSRAPVPLISFITIWKSLGYMIVIQSAGLQAFPTQVRDAARVDGVNVWQYFWRVLVPISKPVIAFVGVMSTFGVVNAFEESYLLYKTSGGPEQGGLILGTYLYREAFESFRIGYASAIAYMMTGIMVVFALLQLRWSRAR
jgi:ABC-type sugar transport system permease subunit